MSEEESFEKGAKRYVGNKKAIDRSIRRDTGQNIIIASGAIATAIGFGVRTDALSYVQKATDAVGSAITRPIESILPGTSKDFTTPKEIFEGTITVHASNELQVHSDPNANSKSLNWKDLKIVTQNYNPHTDATTESLVDPSNGFIVENAMIVFGQNPDGGVAKKGSQWLKLLAEKDNNERMYVYINQSEQTAGLVTPDGGNVVPIKFDSLPGGGFVIATMEPGIHLPNVYQLNHVTPLLADSR